VRAECRKGEIRVAGRRSDIDSRDIIVAVMAP